MDGETTTNGCLQDFVEESSPEFDPSSEKLPLRAAAAAACFDCNICHDFAADPVVTLCGHLYCWPCIFRWLHLDTSHRHCPVCKSSISESNLVPLYGRGLDSKLRRRDDSGIPARPRDHRSFASPAAVTEPRPPPAPRQDVRIRQNYHFYSDERMNQLGVMNYSTAGAVLVEIASTILPWAFRNHEDFYRSLNQSPMARRRNQRCRRELMVESFLHQLWLFLFCCALLCFVCF